MTCDFNTPLTFLKGGIGASTCEAFLARGCRVFAASRSLSKMETLSEAIERVQLDVNDEESIKLGVESILAKTGGRIGLYLSQGLIALSNSADRLFLNVDILVNNAGQGCVAPLIEVDMKRLRATFDVSYTIHFYSIVGGTYMELTVRSMYLVWL